MVTPLKSSILHPIGSNDGRCVQMAGTQSTQADDLRLLGIPSSRRIVAIIYPQHGMGSKDFPATSGQDSSRVTTRLSFQCRARAAQDI